MTAPVQRRIICPVCKERPATRNSPEGPRCGICFAEEFPMLANPIERENKRLRQVTQQREQMKLRVAQGMRQVAGQQTNPVTRALFARAAIILEGGDVLLYEDEPEPGSDQDQMAKGVLRMKREVQVEIVESLIDTGLVTPSGDKVMSDLDGELTIVHGGVE